MASRFSRGQKPLRRRRTKYFDGFLWRNANPDVDLVVSRHTISSELGVEKQFFFPIIPRGEIWVDRRFKNEADFLKRVHRLELRFASWPEKKLRSYIRAKLASGRRPEKSELVAREEFIFLGNLQVTIQHVFGNVVRRDIDPCFILGGHDLVYEYIRDYGENLIWIDILQDPREMPHTRNHEIKEWKGMRWGRMSYARAHRKATLLEWQLRAPERDPENKPLRMIPFMQSPGLCGPASLKIALSYFGKDFSEAELAKLAGASADYGTDHEPMIGALNAVGATVFEKTGGTIDELRYFIQKERLPVIVGWWSCRGANPDFQSMEDEGHFSVIYHISDQYVYLMDPAVDVCLSRLKIKKFLSLWFDTDTPENRRVDRWYIVPNFSGKIFNLPGGKNYPPNTADLPSL